MGRSRGTWFNRVTPVAVEGETTGRHDGNINGQLQTPVKGAEHRSLGGRVERKGEQRTGMWSLRRSLNRLRRSKSNTPAKFAQTPKAPPTMERSGRSEMNSAKVGLSKSVSAAPKLPWVQVQKTDRIQTGDAPGIGGAALGLTPVTDLFRMQTFSKRQIGEKEPKYVKNKKQLKNASQTPCRRRDKRKILAALNQQESVASFARKEAVSMTAIKPSCTFGVRRVKMPSKCEPEAVKVTLGRECSTGTLTFGAMDLSLETSIMNTLYPDGKSFRVDSFCSDEEMDDNVSGLTSEGSANGTAAGRTHGRHRRTNSMKLMQRLTRSSPQLSQTLSINNYTPSPTATQSPISSDGVEPSSHDTSLSCFPGKNILEDSYIMAQINALVNTPVDQTSSTRQGKKRGAATKVNNRNRRVSPLDTTWTASSAESHLTPGRPSVRRSRSLREWGTEGGVVVAGLAGHTPGPRRRRPSYDERLIM